MRFLSSELKHSLTFVSLGETTRAALAKYVEEERLACCHAPTPEALITLLESL